NGFDNTGTNKSGTGYSSLLGILGKGDADYMSKDEMRPLVNEYNTTFAGTLTPAGRAGASPNQRYPTITLPTDFQLGDTFSSQDLRIMKSISLTGRTELRLI